MLCVLSYPKERSEHGYEVSEGEGTWVQWTIDNRPRLETLKRQAVEKLVNLHQNFNGRTESEDGETTSYLRAAAIKKKVRTFFLLGWVSYKEYNSDFEDGCVDSIVEYFTERNRSRAYVDIVLHQFHALDEFLSAPDSTRITLTSRLQWTNRRPYELREFRFFASESDSRRVRLYPLQAHRIHIILDQRLTLQRCHAQLSYLKACLHLQILSITFTYVPGEEQLAFFRSLLCDTLGPERELYNCEDFLKLVLKFPSGCRRDMVMYTGYTINHTLNFEVVLVWRHAFLNQKYIRLWAREVGLYCR